MNKCKHSIYFWGQAFSSQLETSFQLNNTARIAKTTHPQNRWVRWYLIHNVIYYDNELSTYNMFVISLVFMYGSVWSITRSIIYKYLSTNTYVHICYMMVYMMIMIIAHGTQFNNIFYIVVYITLTGINYSYVIHL